MARDDEGKPYSVRYEAVNAMLLNEFLKEHRKVQEQEATIAELKREFQSKLTKQQKRIEALTKGLERVSAQLEADRSPSQVVTKNPSRLNNGLRARRLQRSLRCDVDVAGPPSPREQPDQTLMRWP